MLKKSVWEWKTVESNWTILPYCYCLLSLILLRVHVVGLVIIVKEAAMTILESKQWL